jgi:hypothetical protein
MSTNKVARKKLEKLYGAECFIEKLHLRVDTEPRRYKSKGQMKRMKQLSYHHILERYKGGKATVENGAILSVENHAWLHRQSPQVQKRLNDIFQEYKRQVDECNVVLVDDLEVPFTIAPVEFFVDERGKYNRAKKKQEDMRLIREYEEEER